MRIQKLESTDAFVVWDLEGAERSVGIARLAPKILQEGAEMLARSVTYSFAAFGVKAAGASAGINAKPDGRDAAVEAFVTELAPLAGKGTLVLHAGNGLHDADLAPLTRVGGRRTGRRRAHRAQCARRRGGDDRIARRQVGDHRRERARSPTRPPSRSETVAPR